MKTPKRCRKGRATQTLQKYEELFDGALGDWKTEPVKLELKKDAKPFHSKPFQVPKIYVETLKKEIERLVELGVLEPVYESEWASPALITPKTDMRVRFLSDFRQLNKMLMRNLYPLPKISDIIQQLEGFTYATQLDLNMGYYTIRLDPASSDLCTIIFPWGKYRYKRLPMGFAGSPDIFQAKMIDLFSELEYIRAYLDDLLCITHGDFEDHLAKVKVVLQKLRDAGLRVNVSKSAF